MPDTIDMYEARLHLMSNAESFTVNNVSLPWEPGLYGNLSDVGGCLAAVGAVVYIKKYRE